jgi:uncharacterized protein YcfJ
MDCQKKYPHYIMDFDHARGRKLATVGAMVGQGYSMEALRREIAKCDVVCANCHKARTYARQKA